MNTAAKRKLARKLRSPEYRSQYAQQYIAASVADQLRALRHEREWTQEDLAARADKPQSVISRLEDAGYGKFSVQTLNDLAGAFDVALYIEMMPFDKFLRVTEDLPESTFSAKPYSEVSASIDAWAAETPVPGSHEEVPSAPQTAPAQPLLIVFKNLSPGGMSKFIVGRQTAGEA